MKMTNCGVLRRSKRLQASSSASPRRRRRRSKKTKINGKAAGAGYDNGETDNKKNKKRYIQLSVVEKKSDPYQRLEKIGGLQRQFASKTTNSNDNGNNVWKAPLSCHHLIQEDHALGPWKVLIICILLNKTKGRQVRKILPDLFLLCPNAEIATKVPNVKIEKTIKTLGFQQRRAKTIKKFSHEYLRSEWTHVTQLHGIGKYAADAYAIFCAGKPDKVIPHDHKLVDYWKFVCGKNGDEMSGQDCAYGKIVEHQTSAEDQQDKG